MRPLVMWAAMLLARLQVGAMLLARLHALVDLSKENSMGLEVGENVLPGTCT